ncbi:oxidoreductase [Amycolatopsis pithecellobii]|uniref:FAD-dependent oxidoreductase n=1 Tax=Amycolatopsis pithecellobii TaxID=664692 RepID=A0A6N7YRF7_9PSEU|nr:FAD-dependent oxidoreductase [Amycolatopsis pithecellobii]MTD54488.1 FAD-dependent oxidoreductase [Amycolatopsis pithecellobii]
MSSLASPLRLGPVELRNRVVAAPMERNYCDHHGIPTDHYVRRLAAVATGGTALVYAEAAFVRADGRVRPRQLAADEDTTIAGLRRLADTVHEAGALFGMQLVHGGRLAKAAVSGYQPVAPSPVVATVIDGDLPGQLEPDDIADLAARYADAARRSADAGADVISLHAAHGYLLAQFLSPRTNQRTDRYGDPALFLREVITAVRDAVPGLAVGIRVSAHEGLPDGLDVEATLGILQRAGVSELDFVDVSAGCYEAGQWITPPGEFPRGVHAEAAARFRALGPPVGVAGRIVDGATAQEIISRGEADFVTVARALHADPEWTRKVLNGQKPRPCISCNYCTDALRTGEPVGCAVAPEAAGALPIAAPVTGKPGVLVVGGGPAGLEAARVAAAHGYRTRLAERRETLGGALGLAAQLHEYPEYRHIIDWYTGELAEAKVAVELGTTLSAADIAGQPEEIIVLATGMPRAVPRLPGASPGRVRGLLEWLAEETVAEDEYVVWGADRNGTALADHLATAGARVTLVGAEPELAHDVGPRAKILPLARLTGDPKVRLVLGAVLTAVEPEHIHVRHSGGETAVIPASGPVLVSVDAADAVNPVAGIRAVAPEKTVVAVGDAAGEGGWSALAVRHAALTMHRLAGGERR